MKPPLKFNPDDPAHVAHMRRLERRLVDPHGVGASKGRRPGDGPVPECEVGAATPAERVDHPLGTGERL